MPDKTNLPVSELNRRGIETAFDRSARLYREIERKNCQNRLEYWSAMSDGEYCLLSAAYMAYDRENETLIGMRNYPYQARPMKAAQQRIVDSHWKTFVDLSRIYASRD